jgi:alkanesulfonate monooxygenase SsuD/methylene tetrahydromethanopterin reductase-like flavin-dependent oxidoreductase (luciferase family)
MCSYIRTQVFGRWDVVLLRIFTEPQQGATYDALLAIAKVAEDGFFRADHVLADRKFATGGPGGLPGPSHAWVMLAGLARETARIRLDTLLTAATLRHPGLLAITVARLDAMSSGRAELGKGAGWFEEEHRAYGIPFPGQGERLDRLSEQFHIITGLWGTPVGRHFSFAGRHYRLADSPALPKPVQAPHPPIVIGSLGTRRTPELAARCSRVQCGVRGPGNHEGTVRLCAPHVRPLDATRPPSGCRLRIRSAAAAPMRR